MTYSESKFALASTGSISANTKKKIRTILLHIICWCAFLSLPALFNDHIELTFTNILYDLIAPFRLVNNLFFIALFYLTYYVAIPHCYFTGRYGYLVLYIVLTFGIFFLLNYLMMPPFHGHIHEHEHHEHHHGRHLLGPSFHTFMYIITIIIAFTLCIYTKWRKIYDEKLNTEISFLKAQINPHFLFNTLNSIYSLTLTKSDDAPDAVLKLADMMRYAVSDTRERLISLEKEINYINDYIDLQKLRLDGNVVMQYRFTGNAIGCQIAPFILIPFIENAFKYGVNAEENSNINIDIRVNDGILEMSVVNKKVTIRANADNSTGLGIDATRKRLQLLYPEKHTLTIHNDTDAFNVMLKLNLV